jgi:hypothetical protein
VFNSEDKFSITVSLMTDIVLFVVILVGLRRLRGESGGSFDPGSLPWKQVGLRRFLFVVLLSIH